MDGDGPEGKRRYFCDDVKFIAEMLKENWQSGGQPMPVIQYKPEGWMSDAREGNIYVYEISRYNSVASMDYATIQRTVFVSIRTQAPTREQFYDMVEQVYKIIYSHRRIGQGELHGYTFMEVINDRTSNDLTGWYTNSLDIKLTSYNYPMDHSGFGSEH